MVLKESLEGHKTELYNLIHGQTDKIKDLTQKVVGKSKAQTKVRKSLASPIIPTLAGIIDAFSNLNLAS